MTTESITHEQWVMEMRDVMLEHEHVRKHRPEAVLGDKVRERFLSERARTAMEREANLRGQLRHRKPDEWLSAIEQLHPDFRATIAKIVWWDFFSLRPQSKRWPHLDKFLTEPVVDMTSEEMTQCLLQVGYSPWAAITREYKKTKRTHGN